MVVHNEEFQRLADDAKTRIQEVSVDQIEQIHIELEPILIDVREESEWNDGHADGSIHLSRGNIEIEIANVVPNSDTPIICYCGGGNRSALAADKLQSLGYTNVKSLKGGFRAWQEFGLPTTNSLEGEVK